MSEMDGFDRFDKELASFLREQAPGEAPDRILAGALHRSAAEAQRRGWLGRLAASMSTAPMLRASATAAVLVGAAVIGFQLAGLSSSGSETPSPQPSSTEPSPTPQASPSTEPVGGCPEPPYTFVTVTGVPIEDRPACFGDAELVITGWVLRMSDPPPPCLPVNKPLTWLSCEQSQQPLAFGALPPGPYQPKDRLLWLAADPAGPLGQMTFGAEYGQAILSNTWVEVTGHFNDPAAGGCGVGGGGDPVYARCAGTFVVTSVNELNAPWPHDALASSECITQPLDLLTMIYQTNPVACFGSADITIEVTIGGAGAIDGPCLFFEPAWLSCNQWLALNYVRPEVSATDSVVLAISRSDQPGVFMNNIPSGKFSPSLFAILHPEAGMTLDQVFDRLARVTGHFDDPAALTCRLSEDAPPAFEMTPEEIVTSCRNMFVVTEIVPVE